MDVEMDGVQERVRVRVRKLWDPRAVARASFTHALLAYLQLPPWEGWRGCEGRGTAVTLLDVRDVPL